MKNSWGAGFGDKGYAKLLYGNNCMRGVVQVSALSFSLPLSLSPFMRGVVQVSALSLSLSLPRPSSVGWSRSACALPPFVHEFIVTCSRLTYGLRVKMVLRPQQRLC